ncbi:MAG TPA: Gfo/Idh/MocA family oxidoreductase [Planctomycetes bacterium]|nr:Gfo/Idh/MocA family oxidoreductase [Planctomycetota bacterium]
MKKLRVGIIGMGVGEQHIAGFQNHPACEVAALCDFSAQKREMVRSKYPDMSVYENDEAILANPDIDIVSVASYDNYHYSQTAAAIRNNKHVFVEKPLCLYAKEARRIRSLLRERPDLKLSSNLILRKSERFIRLKKMIDEGRLGCLYCVEGDYNYGRLQKITEGWRGRIDFYSVVYGGAVHIVDLLLWLTGSRVVEVSAYGNNISTRDSQFKYFDTVVSILRFENDITGKVTSNYSCVCPHFHNLAIYGTKGTFVNGRETAKLFCSRDPQAGFEKIDAPYPGVHKGDLIYSFVDSIVNGSGADVTIEDIFKVMSVCFAIEKACQKGGAAEVEYI